MARTRQNALKNPAVDTRTQLLDVAEQLVQTRGYSGFSYRDLADEVGIRTATIHYYFPAKADLGAALAVRYVDGALERVARAGERTTDRRALLREFIAVFRETLERHRMCMCGMMAAEVEVIPEEMATQGRRFMQTSIEWLTKVLPSTGDDARDRRRAMHAVASLEGALLLARSLGDKSAFDAVATELIASHESDPARAPKPRAARR
jgi:TetR/AcrR family transcriptional repressor of nem operon